MDTPLTNGREGLQDSQKSDVIEKVGRRAICRLCSRERCSDCISLGERNKYPSGWMAKDKASQKKASKSSAEDLWDVVD